MFVALADTIEKRDLPIPPLEDMLTAFRMDLDVKRYATIAALPIPDSFENSPRATP